ncbi:MAG: hypothetical protein JO028_22895 [Acidobacteriaceae bacterium]|nr:hypothetical protein [Acidobacteriaceae bacterium]
MMSPPRPVAPYGEYVTTVTYRYWESPPVLRSRAAPPAVEQTASTVRLVPKYRKQDLPVVFTIQFPPRGLLTRERTPMPPLEYRCLAVTGTLWTRYRLDQLLAGEPLALPALPPATITWEEVFASQREAEAAVTQALATDTLLLLDDEVWQAAVEPLYFVQDDRRLFGDAVQLMLVECCEAGCAAQYFRLDEEEDALALRDGLRRYRRERQRKRYREEGDPISDELGFKAQLERPDLLRREPRHELPNQFHPWYTHLRQRLRSLPEHISRADRIGAVLAQARAKDVEPVSANERRLTYVRPEHALQTSDQSLYTDVERAGLLGFLLAAGSYPATAYTGLCDAELARAYASVIRFL